MEIAIALTLIIGLPLALVFMGFTIVETYKWNGGRCRDHGKRWVASQYVFGWGGRVYRCSVGGWVDCSIILLSPVVGLNWIQWRWVK